jgi:hypothetical protein
MITKIYKLASKPVSEALKKKVQRLLAEISNKNFEDLKSDSKALESFIGALNLKKKKFKDCSVRRNFEHRLTELAKNSMIVAG